MGLFDQSTTFGRHAPGSVLGADFVGKLKHENMNITAISLSDLSTAQKIANEIKQEIKITALLKIIRSDIFKSKKQISGLKTQFTRDKKGQKR